MTQEDKELLLKDLCARLPYGVNATTTSMWNDIYIITGYANDRIYLNCPVYDKGDDEWLVESVRPYLRPMSSMTEEESAELSNIISEWFDKELFYLTEEPMIEYALSRINYSINPKLFDWLNKYHFDYRGLIEKGLAIEVTENNPYKDKL